MLWALTNVSRCIMTMTAINNLRSNSNQQPSEQRSLRKSDIVGWATTTLDGESERMFMNWDPYSPKTGCVPSGGNLVLTLQPHRPHHFIVTRCQKYNHPDVFQYRYINLPHHSTIYIGFCALDCSLLPMAGVVSSLPTTSPTLSVSPPVCIVQQATSLQHLHERIVVNVFFLYMSGFYGCFCYC